MSTNPALDGTRRRRPGAAVTPPATRQQSSSSFLGSVVSFGTTALAAYGVYQLASLAYEAWNEKTDATRSACRQEGVNGLPNHNNSFGAAHLRRRHLHQCRHQVRRAMCRLVPGAMKRAILDATDFQKERQVLKDLRSNNNNNNNGCTGTTVKNNTDTRQFELWKTIQVQSVTRLLVTVHASTILFVVLTVQVSVLGRRHKTTQQEQSLWGVSNDGNDDNGTESDIRWVLDQTYQYMFQHGLPSLIQTVQRIVSDSIPDDWNVATSLHFTPQQLKDVLTQVHSRLRDDKILGRERTLLRFVQPPSVLVEEEDNDGDHDTDQAMDRRRMALLDETWDALESPMVEDALFDSLHALQTLLVNRIFSNGDGESDALNSNNEEESSQLVNQLPLAQVLSQIKQACHYFYATFTVVDEQEGEGGDEDGNEENNNYEAHQPDRTPSNQFLTALEHLPAVIETMDVCFG